MFFEASHLLFGSLPIAWISRASEKDNLEVSMFFEWFQDPLPNNRMFSWVVITMNICVK
jgi:hypothetical protein